METKATLIDRGVATIRSAFSILSDAYTLAPQACLVLTKAWGCSRGWWLLGRFSLRGQTACWQCSGGEIMPGADTLGVFIVKVLIILPGTRLPRPSEDGVHSWCATKTGRSREEDSMQHHRFYTEISAGEVSSGLRDDK